jgi:hypothetical protein
LFFLVEQSRGELNNRALVDSFDRYWRHCIRDESERELVGEKTRDVRRGDKLDEADYIQILKKRRKQMGATDGVDVEDEADRDRVEDEVLEESENQNVEEVEEQEENENAEEKEEQEEED